MEVHHKNHHNTYVTSYNNTLEQLQEAQAKGVVNLHNLAGDGGLKGAIVVLF
jgi:Fe-Mn family superoxide dismutase